MKTNAILAALWLVGCAPLPVGETEEAVGPGSLTQVTSFGSNPAGLRMWKYVPASQPANAPLVLALHACGQQAADYQKVGWNALADQYGFFVVYPEQTYQNNGFTCFNWAGSNTNPLTGENDPANLIRGMGENLSIKQMVDQMKKDHSIDGSRVFITGLSGGAAETALMLATWPDVFAAGASFAGIPFHCTTNKNQVTTCLKPGVSLTPKQWGDYVRNADSGYSGPWPRLAIWQGANDSVVSIANSTELMKQWTDVHGISQTPSVTDTVAGVPHEAYRDAQGVTVVETYKVPNMDHGVPVDPKNGCGTAASYILDVGVCSAYWAAVSFGIAGPAASADGGSGGGGSGGSGGLGGGSDGGPGGSGGGSGSADAGADMKGHLPGQLPCGCEMGGTPPSGSALGLLALAALVGLVTGRRRRAC